jgi:hypothetical protein
MMKACVWKAAAGVFLLGACSSNSSANPVDTDPAEAGAPEASGADSGQPSPGASVDSSPPGPCDELTNSAPVVMIGSVPTRPPAPTGGTIVDGTYFVTNVTVFNIPDDAGVSGFTYQQTNVAKAGTYDAVTSVNKAAPTFASGTFTTSGTSISVLQQCPIAQPLPFTGYSSDGVKTLILYGPVGIGGNEAITYTKQ